jgi:threonine/homoserine/homoserine lactone efflux protein
LFEARALPPDSHRKLYFMGMVTCLLNPKVMVFYVSLLPQFIDPVRGSIFGQSIILGATQVLMAFSTHLCIILSAGAVARYLGRRPQWLSIHRYVMASVLSAIAIKLAFEHRRRV